MDLSLTRMCEAVASAPPRRAAKPLSAPAEEYRMAPRDSATAIVGMASSRSRPRAHLRRGERRGGPPGGGKRRTRAPAPEPPRGERTVAGRRGAPARRARADATGAETRARGATREAIESEGGAARRCARARGASSGAAREHRDNCPRSQSERMLEAAIEDWRTDPTRTRARSPALRRVVLVLERVRSPPPPPRPHRSRASATPARAARWGATGTRASTSRSTTS